MVAVNCFNGLLAHAVEDVHKALTLSPDVPILLCDARSRDSAKETLIELVRHALAHGSAALARGTPHGPPRPADRWCRRREAAAAKRGPQ